MAAMALKLLGLDNAVEDFKKLNKRQAYNQVLNFAMIVSTALMIWKGLIVLTDSPSPIVVVLSGSMEPAFFRGDLLFLTNYEGEPMNAGDPVVFMLKDREIPNVHRVLEYHDDGAGNVRVLTKGDNNNVDDRALFSPGQMWLEPKDIVGRVKGYVPYIGMATIIMNDYPKVKYALLAALTGFAVLHREG